ncbi:hypothetical protein [Sulfoacidibacillus thermotolerans]|nr:hypothetical protein [Sulfoacidibacillus thermotolerans]
MFVFVNRKVDVPDDRVIIKILDATQSRDHLANYFDSLKSKKEVFTNEQVDELYHFALHKVITA